MRPWFLVALALIPSTQAAFLEDPAGDAAAVEALALQHADLRSLDVAEDEAGFTFTLTVDAERTDSAQGLGTLHQVYFRHSTRQFRLDVNGEVFAAVGVAHGFRAVSSVLSRLEGEAWAPIASPTPMPHDAGWSVTLARDLLRDADGTEPALGRSLEDVWVEGSARVDTAGLPVSAGAADAAHDRMPDQGTATLPVVFGLAQSGDARLFSDRPFRSSNGEATTYAYDVQAVNIGPVRATFAFREGPLPQGWSVVLPAPLELGPGEQASVTVLATAPFFHIHGTDAAFVLEMGDGQGNVGRIRLGVHYLDVPQPAGHHNQVWLHSRTLSRGLVPDRLDELDRATTGNDDRIVGFINTLSEAANDERLAVPGTAVHGDLRAYDPMVSTYRWEYFLEPGWALGLTSAGGPGTLTLPVESTLDLGATSWEVMLAVRTPNGTVGLNTNYDYAPLWSSTVQEQIATAATLTITAEMPALRVEPLPGQGLVLRIVATTHRVVASLQGDMLPSPTITGGNLILSLEEFHEIAPSASGAPTATGSVSSGASPEGKAVPMPAWLCVLAIAFVLGRRNRCN